MSHVQTLVKLLIDETNSDLKDQKLSISVYMKQAYRFIQSDGYNKVDVQSTL
jgi:hypothetical protein